MEAEPQTKLTGAENVAWDLSDLYASPDDPAIERDIEQINQRAEAFGAEFRGKVASLDPEELYEAIYEYEAIDEDSSKAAYYAHLLWSTDTNNPKYGALNQRMTEWGAQLSQKLVFFELEWTNAPEDYAAKMIENPTLQHYRHWMETTRRYQPHRLTEPEEKILAEKAVTGSEAWVRFFSEFMGAMRYPLDGQQLSQSQILAKLYEPDRELRRHAAAAFTDVLREKLPTLTYIFNTLAADKASNDRLRHYPTWISARNLSNEVSDDVVDALIETVTSNYGIVARYYKLKGQLLGLDTLYDYDRYAPLPAAEGSYSWDEARSVVLNGYQRFSPAMAEVAERFFNDNWIDAALRPGKRSGAFSAQTVPSVHPYILMNYTGAARDVMTLAHELGHGIHQYMYREQGMLQGHPPLTTAEMASVFGEMLIFSDMMQREDDPRVRLAMLAHKIEDTFATVFRQVSMNRFEHGLHNARRDEGELTSERINEIWMGTQRAMFEGSVEMTDDYGVWWSYVPHFLHTPGYVYAYAFGELLVLALFARYRQEGADFVPRYLDVLRMGGSDWPEKVLAPMGVDLTDPTFWQEGIREIDALVAQAEQLVKEIG